MQLICRSHWREAASSADIGLVGRYISRKQLVHILFQTDRMEGPKKQASLFSFFQKTPKSKPGPNGDTSKAESNKKDSIDQSSNHLGHSIDFLTTSDYRIEHF